MKRPLYIIASAAALGAADIARFEAAPVKTAAPGRLIAKPGAVGRSMAKPDAEPWLLLLTR
jgi:hypothetical protein